MSPRVVRILFVVTALFAPALATAAIHDTLFRASFEELAPEDAPADDAEAARFLTQATFGPTTSEIALVRQLGYLLWIDRQLSMPITAARPHMEALNAALLANPPGPNEELAQRDRVDRFYHTAAYGPDQLRQRMAWALSQIFVVSDVSGAINEDIIQMSEYWDLLARGGFGNYRLLLNDVTFSPTMGKYLSHFRNKKAQGTQLPDENYAREVMQLFSIGLVERNPDFSPILIAGQPVPTYDQSTVSEMAKVFTGFNYSNATNIFNGSNAPPAGYLPMTCIQSSHDVGAKTVLADAVLPAGQMCGIDVGDMLNIIHAHANVAPFISRQLIQRFVTSSPSPAYISRIASVFTDNGSAERGDLGAVIRAILLDPDARNTSPDAGFGKLREPVLRMTALWRAWDVVAPPAGPGQPAIRIPMSSGVRGFPQAPLRAPTVFNFYVPDYQQPGPIADANLFSPEFQITNESTAWTMGNALFAASYIGYLGSGIANRPLVDLSPLVATADDAAMVELANQRMLYGAMTTPTRAALLKMLGAFGAATQLEKARSVAYVTALTPEFATQR